ncbi:MAG: hypothetical protein Ct9H90mP25_4040 [Gammaproteobacteria bacterium]|nr:MAG: hypothetical protein Ct9H90mP25_4040 [Gammaproteobacteria bacterium]
MKNLTPIDEAISILLNSLPAIEEIESTPLTDCVGRVLAEDFMHRWMCLHTQIVLWMGMLCEARM